MLSGISECKVAGDRRQSSYKLHSSARAVKKNHTGSYSKKKNSFSSAYVLKWLTDNYIKDPQACIARCVMYAHYEDFCKKQCVSPYSSASFGKIVRMKFPHIKTRRLGTRGQSKYHYYGISVKESSSYYFKGAQIKNGLTRFSCCYLKQTEFAAHPDSSTSLLSFSSLDSISFSKSEKLDTFLLMYKSHCQRFYDSITKENFDEIEDFLLHFWKGMPSHIMSILNYQVTADLILTCDLVLYKVNDLLHEAVKCNRIPLLIT
jgi:regulatory factor X 6